MGGVGGCHQGSGEMDWGSGEMGGNREVLGNRDGGWVDRGGSGPKARLKKINVLMHFRLSGRALRIGKGVKKHANFWRLRRAISFDCSKSVVDRPRIRQFHVCRNV